MTTLDVLVLADGPGSAAALATDLLETAGHRTHRCHDPRGATFPCSGMGGGSCPVDGGIDVAVVCGEVGADWNDGTAPPTGLVCAARADVPVVMATAGGPSTSEGWAPLPVGDELVSAVTEAGRHGFDALAGRILDRIGRPLGRVGIDPASVSCSIARSGTCLRISLRGPELSAEVRQSVAVWAFDVVRAGARRRDRVELVYTAVDA